MSYTIKSAWNPVVYLVGTGDVDLVVVLVLAGLTNFATTLGTGRSAGANGHMVERRDVDGPSWLSLYSLTTTMITAYTILDVLRFGGYRLSL